VRAARVVHSAAAAPFAICRVLRHGIARIRRFSRSRPRAFETTARRRICRHLPPSPCPYKRAGRPFGGQQYTVVRHTEHITRRRRRPYHIPQYISVIIVVSSLHYYYYYCYIVVRALSFTYIYFRIPTQKSSDKNGLSFKQLRLRTFAKLDQLGGRPQETVFRRPKNAQNQQGKRRLLYNINIIIIAIPHSIIIYLRLMYYYLCAVVLRSDRLTDFFYFLFTDYQTDIESVVSP